MLEPLQLGVSLPSLAVFDLVPRISRHARSRDANLERTDSYNFGIVRAEALAALLFAGRARGRRRSATLGRIWPRRQGLWTCALEI